MSYEKLNHPKRIFERINLVMGFVASLITIIGLSLITFFTPIVDHIPIVNEIKMEKKVESIRIGFDREYLEDILGKPSASDSFQFFESGSDKKITITVKDYINDLYFGKLFYKDNERLIAYIIISRQKGFNPMLPQKDSGIYLSSADMDSVNMIYCKTSHLSSRNDNSYYYLEFEHPWLGDNFLLYGYAYTDNGYSRDESDKAVAELISLRNTSLKAEGSNYLSKINQRNETKDTLLKVDSLKAELPVNTAIAIDESVVSTFDFLDLIGENGLGFTRLEIKRFE